MKTMETDDFLHQLPADNETLRRGVYAGRVFRRPATAESLAFTGLVAGWLRAELGGDLRTAHERFDDADLFARVGRVRRAVFEDGAGRRVLAAVIAGLGFDLDDVLADPARLRAAVHLGARNPRAAAVYYAHRDTWYSYPHSLVNLWSPLHDVDARETFVFYPECFGREVANDSETHDYDSMAKDEIVGWQNRDAAFTVAYPRAITENGYDGFGRARGFGCRAGDVLIFSGAHLHRTLPQESGLSRFSVDARLVHRPDHEARLGAPCPDDRSRGSRLPDFLPAAAWR